MQEEGREERACAISNHEGARGLRGQAAPVQEGEE